MPPRSIGEALRFEGHHDSVTCLAYLPDGRRLISGSDDLTVRVWDAAAGEVSSWQGPAASCISVSPDGQHVVIGEIARGTVMFEIATGTPVRRFKGTGADYGASAVAFSPEGRLVAAGGHGRVVHCFDAQTGQELRVLEGAPRRVVSVAFSPDRRLVLCSGLGFGGVENLDAVCIWDLQSATLLRRIGGVGGAATFSPDGRRVLATGEHNEVFVWDAVTGDELSRFSVGTGALGCIDVSRDGRWLLTGSHSDYRKKPELRHIFGEDSGPGDYAVRLLDAADGRELCRLDGHTADVNAVAFSPARGWAASASSDRTIRLWAIGV